MLLWLAFACNKSPKEVVKSPGEGDRFSQTDLERLGEPRDSVCRGLALPEIDLQGCQVVGPYQGVLEGTTLATGLEFDKALQACLSDPKCSGIATDWYADTPFATMQSRGGFAVDSDSYGCSFILVCPN